MNRATLSIVLSCCVWSGVAVAAEPTASKSSPSATACSGTPSTGADAKKKVGFRVMYGSMAPLPLGAAESAPASWRLPGWKGPVSATFSTRPDGSLQIALSVDANGEKKKVKEAVLKAGEAITFEPTQDGAIGYFGDNPSTLKVEFTGPYQPKA